MPQTAAPFILKDVVVTLTLNDAGGGIPGSPIEIQCQLNRAELVPSASGGAGEQSYDTFCGPHKDPGTGGGSTWTLELSNFQAYTDVEDLTLFLFDHEGKEASYTLMPLGEVTDTKPAFEGVVTLVAQNIGGTALTYATSTVSLPCKAKPTKRIAVELGATSRGRDKEKAEAS
jgi:hypothetical protein